MLRVLFCFVIFIIIGGKVKPMIQLRMHNLKDTLSLYKDMATTFYAVICRFQQSALNTCNRYPSVLKRALKAIFMNFFLFRLIHINLKNTASLRRLFKILI